ncbi:24145_t:CDS:2, partial [Cetraspora pellucida]
FIPNFPYFVMPKPTITKKWQQKRAEVARSACASYSLVDLDSSEEYLDSSGNSDESSDDNFIKLNNLDNVNIIIEQLHAGNDELGDELDEELDQKKKKFRSVIEFVEEVLNDEVLSTTEKARYLAVLYFLHLCLQGQKKSKHQKQSQTLLMKGLYADGHERPDVIEYCQTFLLEEHIWVTHNKTTFYVYNRPHSVWGSEGEQPLRKKRLGAAMHISDFLTETIGSLKDDQEEARVMMNSEKLLEQVKWVVNIFEQTHLGCVGVFAFDNIISHKAFSENALVASKMNLGPGGLAPKMHETMWNSSRQSMIIENDHFIYDKKKKTYVNLHGQPKGIQWVLNERGLCQDGMMLECISCKKKEADSNIIDCCMHRLMANQPDFFEQCSQIQQEIESCGHK